MKGMNQKNRENFLETNNFEFLKFFINTDTHIYFMNTLIH